MENTVRAFINRHQLIKENSNVLIAVSGGPDSMALLHFFWRIRSVWNLRLIVVSVDHQLRGDASLEDVEYVREMCWSRDVEFISTSLDVPAYKHERHLGTQVAARELRYQFFAEQMNTYKADYLALGHHGDDQAETMLMSFARSATAKSLAGIPLKRDFASGQIVRPLLCVTKETIERYCNDHGITPRRDPSNEEDIYTRNDFRHNILPLLKEKNQNLHRTLQHLSGSLQEDEAFLQQEAIKMAKQVIVFGDSKTDVSFQINTFKAFPRSLQRRCFHLILNYLYNETSETISYVHEDQFFKVLETDHGHIEIDFPDRLKLEKSYQTMSFYFLNDQIQSSSYHRVMDLPGKTVLANGMVIISDIISEPDLQGEKVYVCREDAIALPLHIRTRKAGDRMRWKGLNGSKKVKDIFIDAKIPLNERDKWPVITDNNGDILWLPGLKKGWPPGKAENGNYIQLKYGMEEKHAQRY
ncbi:tRNA lysidine(34) synthetase TilS [Lentibacillus amyloliquefaciens]|uniref:tRNA(Ile)-lysidine synthase n=1 Tax=Lentibacillus amyloliquefaciens TaxID=1472767 RepID=A0A0U3WCB2_9BACI|nr:tRNA lysidine(34) synthetase TilS [Lentibacillus amyloliquefaciens]ALX50640.1 tRNA(Ile)-lysidine synthetase [Lentibacillus amyloliquefaciens]